MWLSVCSINKIILKIAFLYNDKVLKIHTDLSETHSLLHAEKVLHLEAFKNMIMYQKYMK